MALCLQSFMSTILSDDPSAFTICPDNARSRVSPQPSMHRNKDGVRSQFSSDLTSSTYVPAFQRPSEPHLGIDGDMPSARSTGVRRSPILPDSDRRNTPGNKSVSGLGIQTENARPHLSFDGSSVMKNIRKIKKPTKGLYRRAISLDSATRKESRWNAHSSEKALITPIRQRFSLEFMPVSTAPSGAFPPSPFVASQSNAMGRDLSPKMTLPDRSSPNSCLRKAVADAVMTINESDFDEDN